MKSLAITMCLSLAAALSARPLPKICFASRPPFMKYPLKQKTKRKMSFEEELLFVFNLKSQLAGGANFTDALRFAVNRAPGFALLNTRQALASQVDVLPALHKDSLENTFSLLVNCANLLEINSSTGSSVTEALNRITQAMMNRRTQEQLISTELASTKATVFVLAGLPVMGAGMGLILGTDSISWLLSSTVGRTCLVFGVILEVAGWLWIKRLLNGALVDVK